MDEVPRSNQPLQTAVPEGPHGGGKPREAYWDNVKAVCVFLVVWCHTLFLSSFAMLGVGGQGQDQDPQVDFPHLLGNHTRDIAGNLGGKSALASVTGLVFALTVVVMPGFCFASGHLSSRELTPRRARNLFQVGTTACIMQVLTAVATASQTGLPVQLYGAVGVQWFLFCLVFWRVTLPFWMMLRRPLLASVVVGTLTLLTDATNTLFHCFLSFLPFFIAGYLTPRKMLKRFRRPACRVGFLAVITLAAVIPPLFMQFVLPHIGKASSEISDLSFAIELVGNTYNCFMYESTACAQWAAIPLRLLYYLFAVPMIPAFLAMIPEKEVWFLTRAGQLSMYIYLLHMLLVIPFIAVTAYFRGGLFLLASLLYSFFIWALLGTGCARPCCKWCIEPRIDCFVQPWVLSEGEDQPRMSTQPVAAVAEA